MERIRGRVEVEFLVRSNGVVGLEIGPAQGATEMGELRPHPAEVSI
jgi:hypothetical protein